MSRGSEASCPSIHKIRKCIRASCQGSIGNLQTLSSLISLPSHAGFHIELLPCSILPHLPCTITICRFLQEQNRATKTRFTLPHRRSAPSVMLPEQVPADHRHSDVVAQEAGGTKLVQVPLFHRPFQKPPVVKPSPRSHTAALRA